MIQLPLFALQQAVTVGSMPKKFASDLHQDLDPKIHAFVEATLETLRKVMVLLDTESFEAFMEALFSKDLRVPYSLERMSLSGQTGKMYNFGICANKIKFTLAVSFDFSVHVLYEYVTSKV